MPTRDREIEIQSGAEYISGTLVTPDTLIPGVLFVHGWGGSQAQYLTRAREIASLGCVCLTFDLSGHARTEPQRATVTRANNLRDVLAAYDALVQVPTVDTAAIAVVGSSYGGYLAAVLSSLRPIKWLGLRAPALYSDRGWELPKIQLHKDQDLVKYRRSFVPAAQNRALKACSTFMGDALIIESESDDVVPHPVIESYIEAFAHTRSLTYRVIQHADHGLSAETAQRAYTTVLTHWLREMVAGAREGNAAAPSMQVEGAPEGPPQPA